MYLIESLQVGEVVCCEDGNDTLGSIKRDFNN